MRQSGARASVGGMSTPPQNPDPFSTPAPGTGATPPPPSGYPPAPGYASAGLGAPPIVVGYSPVPRTLGLWATILTGAYALVTLLGALAAPSMVDKLKDAYADPDHLDFSSLFSPLSLLGLPVFIASYVLLALWMSRTRSYHRDRGQDPRGIPAVEWWGWFIPIAWFVLPLMGMRAITRRTVSMAVVLGWWIPFCAFWIAGYANSFAQNGAIDRETNKLVHPEKLDAMVGYAWAQAIFLLVAWAFLALIIRTSNDRSEAPQTM